MNYIRKTNMGLARFTSLKIGGVASSVFFPMNQEGIAEAFKEIEKSKNPSFFILGGGCNSIIQEGKLDLTVVLTSYLSHYRFLPENSMRCQGGLNLSVLAELVANNNLSGLEFCYGLPGTVGGATFMNARAYDKQMADIIEKVVVFDYEKKEFITLLNLQCNFGYKQSIFQQKPYLIFEVYFKLKPLKDKSEIWRLMDQYRLDREKKGQYLYPSAGCAFKNNPEKGVISGKLIEELGLKGFQIGGMQVSEKHGNFIVNKGGGSFKDYQKLVTHIKEKALEERQIKLECEVRFF